MSVKACEEREEPLPEPTMAEMILGAALLELELTNPGITERALQRLNHEAARAEVVRLRGPRTPATARTAMAFAVRWLTAVAGLAEAERPMLERFKRRKRR